MPTITYNLTLIDEFQQGAGHSSFYAPTIESANAAGSYSDREGGVGWAMTSSTTGLYGAECDLVTASSDLSTGQYIWFQLGYSSYGSPEGYDTLANGGLRVAFIDGSGNWARFNVMGSDIFAGAGEEGSFKSSASMGRAQFANDGMLFVIDTNRTPDAESGTAIDWTDVDSVGIYNSLTSSKQGNMAIGRLNVADRPLMTGGTTSVPSENAYFFEQRSSIPNDGDSSRWFVRPIEGFNAASGLPYVTVYGADWGDGSTATVWRETGGQTVFYQSRDAQEASPTGLEGWGAAFNGTGAQGQGRKSTYTQTASCDHQSVGHTWVGTDHTVREYDLEFTGHASASDHSSTNDIYLNANVITYSNWDVSGPIYDGCNEVSIDNTVTMVGAVFRNSLNIARGLRFTSGAGTYTSITASFVSSNAGIDLTVGSGGAGTYTFDGLSIGAGHTLHIWNESTTNAVTVALESGVTNQPIDLWFDYDNEASGPFTEGETLTFGNGATAKLARLIDDGTTGTMYCELLTGSAPPDNNSITGGTSSATANVNEASGANSSSLTITQTVQTLTINSDTASTLIRYFEDDSQTVVDSTTGTTLDYDYPDTDPMDIELVKQGYVPVNRQNVTPYDGDYDVIMDLDEAYNSSHGLTITTEYDVVRATKALTINSDQNALDVRSSFADVIRTNSSYYNTELFMVAIPGLTRVDLISGATITSMATWKGAGMERFDAADALNPTEKWFCIKSVGDITGASAYYRQTSSGSATSVTLTNNVVDEAFQYWNDPNHDGSTADGYDRSGYMVIKTFLAGSKQGRVDIPANAGLSALVSNLYTVPLSNTSHDYAGTDPGISADITIVAGSTVGGVVFSYEIVDGGTNSGSDIADQLHYNALTTPNSTVPGGTGLTWWELPDMVIYNATSVETERGYEEGASPSLVGFYVSRSSADHPDFTRFQGDNGTYYTPAVTANGTGTNLPDDIGGSTRLQILNLTASTASAHQTSTAYSVGDVVLRTSGLGTESTAGLFFRCISAGTSGGTEPTWVITTPGVFGTSGSQTTDNTVTWECFAVLLYDADPAGTGWSDSYNDGEEFAAGETARIRFGHLNGGTSFEYGQTTAAVTSSGFSFDGSLFVAGDSVYAENLVDGSSAAVTNIFTADYANNEIDLDADLNFTSLQFFAYYCYELTSTQGMHNFWGGVTAIDSGNYRINDSVVSLYFDETAGFVRQTDTARIFRADGTRPALDPTTGGAGVEVNWQLPVYVQAVGSALTGPQAASLSAIETATAGLTYTVANKVDANVHYVNDVEVDGAGTAGDPWGPV